MAYTLGLDFGTLSGRCVVVSCDDGSIVANVAMNYPHAVMSEYIPTSDKRLPADYALQMPADYERVLEYTVSTAVKESGVAPSDIIGICVDFTTCTVFPVDENARPLCEYAEFEKNPHAYVKLWKHHAAEPYAERINSLLKDSDDDRVKDFGGKVSSEWLLPKLLQVYEEAPEIYERADIFTEAGDWIVRLLTGVRSVGYMFAAYKGLYVDGKGYFDEKFLESLSDGFGDVIKEKYNSPVTPQGVRVGGLNAEWAQKLGLCEGIAVTSSIPDAHVAPPALGITEPGVVSSIFGTSACFMTVNEEYHEVPGICGVVKDGVLPGFYGYEAGLCCYGDLFAWFCDNCVPEEYKTEAEKRGLPVIGLLTEMAEKLAIGESGLIALDWWNGNRNILSDAKLSGLIVGMTMNTKPHEIYRALIEATAFATKTIFDTLENNGVKINRLHAGGGIAKKNPFAMQMLSDVLGKEIRVSSASQIPALASAIYAAVAAGKEFGGYSTLSEATEHMAAPFEVTYLPDSNRQKRYMKLYNEYLILHDFFGRGGNDVMKRLRTISDEAKNNQ